MTDINEIIPEPYKTEAAELRAKARKAARQGKKALAKHYGRRVQIVEDRGRMTLLPEEDRRLTIGRRRYRVHLAQNLRGRWSANAYRIGDRGFAGLVMPSGFASGDTREEALAAVKTDLESR